MPTVRARFLAFALAAGGLAALLAWLVIPALAPEPISLPFEETAASGRWRLDLGGMDEVGDGPAPSAEDRARRLSLPYSAGSRPAGGATGVVYHDRERAAQGLNLVVSGHGPEAVLLDMDGAPLHRWRYPFARAFPDKWRNAEAAFFRRAHLAPDGRLTVLFQTGGLLRIDARSRLLWANAGDFYNHLSMTPDGRVLSLTKRLRRDWPRRPGEEVLEDFLVELDAETGALLREISLLEAIERSPWAEALDGAVDHADILHSNTVIPLDGRLAGRHEAFAAGNVLLSFRELDMVAVLDPEGESLVWALQGSFRRQHQPILLESGQLLLFDNRGAGSGARLLQLDPVTGRETWRFPPPGVPLLRSPEAGSCQELANGNLLITESERGRAFEITPAGEVVWELRSPHRAGERRQLVATLFEVVRLAAPTAAEGTASTWLIAPSR